MNFENPIKNRKPILLILSAIFIIGIFIFLYSPIIFQENPWREIKGIVKLTFNSKNLVRLSESDNKFLTKSRGGFETIDSFLKDKGYQFIEQMGSGYFYKAPDSNIVVIRRQYSRFYVIWTITKK